MNEPFKAVKDYYEAKGYAPHEADQKAFKTIAQVEAVRVGNARVDDGGYVNRAVQLRKIAADLRIEHRLEPYALTLEQIADEFEAMESAANQSISN